MKQSSARIIAKPTPGITPEQARDARARCWKFVFGAYAEKNAAEHSQPDGDDGTKIEGDSANESIISEDPR